MYELVEVIQKNAPPMLRHSGMVPVGDANARRPAPNPAGCPAWARSRQPRYWAWNAAGWSGMTLAIDGRADVQKGCHVLRGGGPVACVMPVVTEFVTLLADFVTHSIGLTA